MESLVFLLVMLGVIVVGTAVLLLRAREPKGEYRGIKSFQREMQALAPATPPEGMERPAGVDPLLYERLRTAMAETAGSAAGTTGATGATGDTGGPAASATGDVSGPRPAEHQE